MYYYDSTSLQNELNCGQFETCQKQLDSYKVIEALNFLISEVDNLKSESSLKVDIVYLEQEISELKKELANYRYLFKAISKDYPEIVISKPELFVANLI